MKTEMISGIFLLLLFPFSVLSGPETALHDNVASTLKGSKGPSKHAVKTVIDLVSDESDDDMFMDKGPSHSGQINSGSSGLTSKTHTPDSEADANNYDWVAELLKSPNWLSHSGSSHPGSLHGGSPQVWSEKNGQIGTSDLGHLTEPGTSGSSSLMPQAGLSGFGQIHSGSSGLTAMAHDAGSFTHPYDYDMLEKWLNEPDVQSPQGGLPHGWSPESGQNGASGSGQTALSVSPPSVQSSSQQQPMDIMPSQDIVGNHGEKRKAHVLEGHEMEFGKGGRNHGVHPIGQQNKMGNQGHQHWHNYKSASSLPVASPQEAPTLGQKIQDFEQDLLASGFDKYLDMQQEVNFHPHNLPHPVPNVPQQSHMPIPTSEGGGDRTGAFVGGNRKKVRKFSSATAAAAGEKQTNVPIIIHEIQPEIIHINKSKFRETVQKLTGNQSGSENGHQHQQTDMPMEKTGNRGGDRRSAFFRTYVQKVPKLTVQPTIIHEKAPTVFNVNKYEFKDIVQQNTGNQSASENGHQHQQMHGVMPYGQVQRAMGIHDIGNYNYGGIAKQHTQDPKQNGNAELNDKEKIFNKILKQENDRIRETLAKEKAKETEPKKAKKSLYERRENFHF